MIKKGEDMLQEFQRNYKAFSLKTKEEKGFFETLANSYKRAIAIGLVLQSPEMTKANQIRKSYFNVKK